MNHWKEKGKEERKPMRFHYRGKRRVEMTGRVR
jgi:hypothetical protein